MTATGLRAAARSLAATALDAPHHDGSDLHVLEHPTELGQRATVRLRVPHACAVDSAAVRFVCDGEPAVAEAVVDQKTEGETWWRSSFPVSNPSVRYRWLLAGGSVGYGWLNGLGLTGHDVPDADDFVISLAPPGPDWHLGSVVYEIFPDRFASSGREVEAPAWALRRDWDARPTGRGPETPFEWFGGDLLGIEGRLDHVEGLGASVLYLTPFFPAGSTHRYDARSFEEVDPLLGGDEALRSLVRAAHARGLRVLGDLTLNHVGDGHDWFQAARDDAAAPERDFFLWDDGEPAGYVSWLGISSLPKLDWTSGGVRSRMAGVVRRWLEPPFDLDGWRVDVANMAGRHGAVDVGAEVARSARAAAAAARSDALLVAEHGHDAREVLARGDWHGTMNYAGFTRPVWAWLAGEAHEDPFLGLPVRVPRLLGADVVATMRAFRAGVPWQSVLHSWTILDSHDTARFRTVTGSRERQLVGVSLQLTTPGVPMIFAGAELGLEGDWGEDARRPIPWHRPETWDSVLLDGYRGLIELRRSSPALARGGIRYLLVGDDAIAYLRETRDERLLCVAARVAGPELRFSPAALACAEIEPLDATEASLAGGKAVLHPSGPSFGIWRLT